MRIIFTLFILVFLSFGIEAQTPVNYWSASTAVGTRYNEMPKQYKAFALNYENFKAALRRAPMEFTRDAETRPLIVDIPMPDGHFEPFAVVESPTMAPELAARYPELKSFGGQGIHDSRLAMKFTHSPTGLQAIIKTPEGMVFITPLDKGQTGQYMSFFSRYLPHSEPFICGVDDSHIEHSLLEGLELTEETGALETTSARAADPVPLRVYRMALACTGEFADIFNNSKSEVMDAFNTAVNQLNLVFELEVAVRFQMIPNNDTLIFTDGATDPYERPTLGRELLTPNNDYLNTTIGFDNYDVGHIFTGPCSDIAGVAQLQGTCGPRKGAGVTCFNDNDVIARVNTVMTHEIGHQFGASHTWNSCPGSDDQREGTTAFEPGSGTTIMSYAGVCSGGQNIQSTNDLYFHNGSLTQMYEFSRDGNGNTCANVMTTTNNTPDLTLPYTNNFFIPIRTPFQLTAEGSDIDGDQITYCWEQYDTGPEISLGQGIGSAPLFRSFPPSGSPTRFFPKLTDIINNIGNSETEVLPDYDRTLNFRCTARDNVAGNGGVVWEQMTFKSTTTAGPFRVSNPSTSETWEVGEEKEITWNVANTDNATVNCQKVNILLSTNRGFNFQYTLASGVPNDGSHMIIVPNAISNLVRIKVEAADNVFFDLSNQNVSIVAPSQPALFLTVGPYSQQVCLPANATIDMTTDSLAGFNSEVTYMLEGLPAGATPVFGANPAIPSEPNTLSLDLSNVTEDGVFEVVLVGMASGITTVRRSFFLDLVYNDFSALTLDGPAQGAQGVSDVPSFSWADLPHVGTVRIEIATDPSFNNIIFTESGITGTSYQPSSALDKNTTYYWRLKPTNECGEGEATAISAFRTESLACAEYSNIGANANISSAGLDSAKVVVNSSLAGNISDFNVKKVKGTHDLVKHIDVSVVSPSGKEVLLFTDLCGNTTQFDLGFDDQAASDMIPCPPTNGAAYRPAGQLADFNNESGGGDWTLKAKVNSTQGNGGTLQDVVFEICSNISLSNPSLSINDPLCVKPGEFNPISDEFLLSTHPDNIPPENLTYRVLSLPANGTLQRGGVDLGVGSSFTQLDVNNKIVYYLNNLNSSATSDNFRFDVTGGDGWFGAPLFNINIDASCITGTKDLYRQDGLTLFPNPAQSQINLRFEDNISNSLTIKIFNIQGQLLYQADHQAVGQTLPLSTRFLNSGMYIMEVQAEDQLYARKFNIQR